MSKLSHLELEEAFAGMTVDQLVNFRYLSNFIYDKVGLSLNTRALKIKDPPSMGCWGGLQCKQYPDELAKFLVFIYQHKDDIKSYCEIGVERGGTFFVVDSFLRSINPDMGDSLAIDISCRRGKPFVAYSEKYPQVTFKCMDSGDLEVDRGYDLCFIDGDHSYEGCKRDFEMAKSFSKYIGFHDIHFTGAGVIKLWDEISGEKFVCLNEDTIQFPVSLGIGVIKNESDI